MLVPRSLLSCSLQGACLLCRCCLQQGLRGVCWCLVRAGRAALWRGQWQVPGLSPMAVPRGMPFAWGAAEGLFSSASPAASLRQAAAPGISPHLPCCVSFATKLQPLLGNRGLPGRWVWSTVWFAKRRNPESFMERNDAVAMRVEPDQGAGVWVVPSVQLSWV